MHKLRQPTALHNRVSQRQALAYDSCKRPEIEI